MEEFKDLENIWKQSETHIPTKKIDVLKIKNNRNTMKNNYIKGAVFLILTGIFILVIMMNLNAEIKNTLVISSMIIISVICFLQALIMIFTAKKIDAIDDTQTPALHLQQWQNFRIFQKKMRSLNLPVYYILLSLSLGIYMYELLKNVELWKMILAFCVTYFWMIFAYFYLGKKKNKKEDAKMDSIIAELKNLETQFH